LVNDDDILENSVLKTEPVIEPEKYWFTDLLVEPLGHWSNRMIKPDKSVK
jgi:hypothetical protein